MLTFREGLLSPLAHDLVLRVTAFEIAVDPAGPRVEASFDANMVRQPCAAMTAILRIVAVPPRAGATSD